MDFRTFEPEEGKSIDAQSVARTDVIYPPSLPSNLDKDRCYPAKFNTNGFYGCDSGSDIVNGSSIQDRLDSQIRALLNVYDHTVAAIQRHEREKNDPSYT
ncbi:unnamed protein product [Moneuplotes crassus]|uniref:Uncharacterized protein n=1 Tax=Euplotes crassus TaxID=5936 RepID=A0AAD1Y0K7_EUPCR|nr:unnamed protein product [Moneuplotes crassus]